MIRRFCLVILILMCSVNVFSQEFKVNVSVSATQLQGTDREIFTTIQNALNDFVNQKQWTNFHYEDIEKIEGSITINVKTHATQEDFSEICIYSCADLFMVLLILPQCLIPKKKILPLNL